jgi:hypothetical protein
VQGVTYAHCAECLGIVLQRGTTHPYHATCDCSPLGLDTWDWTDDTTYC